MKYVATLNGKKYEVEVEKVESGFKPLSRAAVVAPKNAAAPAPAAAPAAAPAPAPAAAPAAPAAGSTEVKCPMPGTILDVKVAPGAAVKSGQILLILEAMKMENEIVSPKDATVVSVAVKKGDAVNSNDTLVVLS